MSDQNPKSTRPKLPWRRFWIPLGGTIDCGPEGGFLTDPEDRYGRHANPTVALLAAVLPEIGPIVLCGEPGIGKSTELDDIRTEIERQGEGSCWLVFRDVADLADFRKRSIESAVWQTWRAGVGRMNLVVDGIDEGLLRVPNFINDLVGLLRGEPLDRLRLVLACRTAEWPVEMGRRLLALWPTDAHQPIYELCPLRRADAEAAARTLGCDVDAFLSAVWDRHVTALAARPVTLFFLIDEFLRHGGLPATHRELYERGTANLVREVDPARLELLRALRKTELRITDAERLRAAQRLAALLLLSGRSAVRVSSGAFGAHEGRDLLLDDAAGTGSSAVSLPALEEAVESALFTSVGERRFAFVHQTFAECLASQHLAALPLRQLRQLICQRDARGEHVIPQLSELAAWVAGNQAEFCEHVLRVEPEILLRSDVARLQGQLKARLVEAVLIGVTQNKIFDDIGYRRFLSGLDHPGLAAQLRPFISDTGGHVIARRIAMRIAGDCRCMALVPDLLSVAMNTADSNHMRDQAASALEDAVPEGQLPLLEPLAKGEALPDPDDSIKGSALRRLVPKHWSVRAALPYITHRKNTRFLGAYEMFLRYELPKALTVDDLPEVLAWLNGKTNALDSLNSFHKIASAAFTMALDHLDVPAISTAVADLWQIWLKRHDIQHLPHDSQIRTVLAQNATARQQLAAMFLDHPKTVPEDAHRLLWPLSIIHGAASLDWLLAGIMNAQPERRANWAAAIAILARDPFVGVSCWDKLLLRIDECVEMKSQFEWLRGWEIDEPRARKAKAQWLCDKRRHAQAAKYNYVAPDPKIAIEAAFNAFANGDRRAWIPLWYELIRGTSGHEEFMLEADVTSCPSWQLLSPQQAQIVPEIARAFLLSDARNDDHQHKTSINALSASSAVWMLRDKLEIDEELRQAVVSSWLGTLVLYMEGSAVRSELFKLALELSPDVARGELMLEAASEATQHQHPFSFRVAAGSWSPELSTAAIDLIASSTDPKVVLNGLTEIAAHDLGAVVSHIETVLSSVAPGSDVYPIQLFGALVVGLSFAPEQFWSSAEALLSADADLARVFLARLCYGLDLDRKGTLKKFTEAQLANFYQLLRRTYPPSADPPEREGGFVSGADCARSLRGQLPGLIAARGTEAACVELGKLANSFPEDATWLRWSQREAITNVRRNRWQPPSPSTVRSMIGRADARIVSSEEDLLELVMESLDRLQHQLTNQSLPRAEDLWHWDGAGLRRSKFRPKDEEALSDYVARWLTGDVGPSAGVVVNREVQPRRGARTDVIVEASSPGSQGNFDKLTIVIEVKGCWHATVRTGLETQLVDGYLKVHGWRCGIYLVGWFVCPQWETPKNKLQSATAVDAATELDALAAGFDGINSQFHVRTFLLDCTLPPQKAPSA